MKNNISFLLLSAVAGLVPFTASGQIVAQHSGANDPETQGFFRVEFGQAQLDPVFGDAGFDAWSFDSRIGGGGFYGYQFSVGQQQAALTHGWELTVRMRIVAGSAGGAFSFNPGPEGFSVDLLMDPSGDILVRNGVHTVHTLVGGGGEYHEYSMIYDPIEEIASLWITGVGHVADLAGHPALPEGRLYFGMRGFGHTHWNDVTLTIIPEPATAALLAGTVVLLAVGILRRRQEPGRLQE